MDRDHDHLRDRPQGGQTAVHFAHLGLFPNTSATTVLQRLGSLNAPQPAQLITTGVARVQVAAFPSSMRARPGGTARA